MGKAKFVSVHGGHSGEFCSHATNTLDEVIQTYITHGYSWVGITEHVPGLRQELLYPDQQALGLTPEFLLTRFTGYMQECRRLQDKYKDRITLYTAMELETYSGYETFIPALTDQFQPDYLVGSVHFVDDLGFDYSREQYDATAKTVGGIDRMYCRYFDLQYDMIGLLKPAVIGHFDLIRIFDPEYKTRLLKPEIHQRVIRNLQLIKDLDLIMDFNLRSLAKGAEEPYITESILRLAKDLDIAVVPGDDSHGVDNIHLHMERAIAILANFGFSTKWRVPKTIDYSNR